MSIKPTPHLRPRQGARHRPPAHRPHREVVYGDVWESPELSKRDRSLMTCAALVVFNRTEQLKGHLERV